MKFIKVIIKFVLRILKIKNKILKPTTVGVRIILIKNNKVLLVRHTYDNYWYLPGGGVKKKESFERAICRELKEELGTEIYDMKLFGVYNNFYENKNDNIIMFESKKFKIHDKSSIEIEEYKFCKIDDTLKGLSPGTRRRLKEYLEGNDPYHGMW
ncbi:NUDIX domain-containing protein [Clostridiaceae bacterium M8S5]|nr:NUDIX domain-containing protein [Clostridiaceae bacterium M8S5]